MSTNCQPHESEGQGDPTKIPEPPIHFSAATNFFGPKNEFSSHQFDSSVLESTEPKLPHEGYANEFLSSHYFYILCSLFFRR